MSQTFSRARRHFFAQAGAGLMAWAAMPGLARAMEGMGDMPKTPPRQASANFHPDVELDLICQQATQTILPGLPTRVLKYTGKLLKGPAGTLSELPDSYLGPLLRFETGQKIRINLRNRLHGPTITHWHGLHVPAEMDGHPLYEIAAGETYVYEFEMRNRAGMNLYHPHTHNLTGKHVYQGLAGAILVNDSEERRLGLPDGEYEIPIVIQDRRFDGQNQLVYASHMHDRMMGFYGDRILVNGRPDFQLDADARAYRFRVLNGSTARIYKLAWDDASPVTVIGCDGGLLETPIDKPYVMLAPGERIDVWADFSGRKVGTRLTMRSRSFSGVLPGMGERMMGGMHGSALPVGGDYPIFQVRIARPAGDSPALPHKLSTIKRYRPTDTANPRQPVPIGISEGPMRMVLNDRPYAFNDIQPGERIQVDTLQTLEIFHAHGGMGRGGMMGMGRHGMGGNMGVMMAMAHPIHLHGQQFQILERDTAGVSADYASVKDGFIDSGWKDTVLVMPGERIKMIKPFQDFKGLFMYHCHNLEHEDMGMMRDFLVE